MTALETSAQRRAAVTASFAAIYLIWGSTYLAIRFAIETVPPFLGAGVRFLAAGALMYVWARLRGSPPPAPRGWAAAALIGSLMLVVGVGGVSWAEQRVPSGAAALLIGVGPLCMVLVDWLFFRGERPGGRTAAGIVLGFLGVALLIGPEQLAGTGRIDLLGTAVIMVGTVTWSFGSLYSREAPLPAAPIMATAAEMLAAGIVLVMLGVAVGEWPALAAARVSPLSLLALAYLALFGSVVALTAYLWLLKHVSPARVTTHAFVNPVVAVFLGWAFAGESLGPRTLAATGVIVAGVLVLLVRGPRRAAPPELEHG
jgi:drug/metabolite transporter (DMT)-like permease